MAWGLLFYGVVLVGALVWALGAIEDWIERKEK